MEDKVKVRKRVRNLIARLILTVADLIAERANLSDPSLKTLEEQATLLHDSILLEKSLRYLQPKKKRHA